LLTLAAPASLALTFWTTAARADVTSWLALGGGYGLARNGVASSVDGAGAFSASIGVGTSPHSSLVFGGMFRSMTFVGLGTDISLGARMATGGFARGDWGFAIDLGLGYRYWRGGDYGQFPVQPIVTLGAPWGVQLAVGANVFDIAGGTQAVGGFAVLEIDLLRLTLMRQGSTDSAWRNPLPAGGRSP
jgi:hypothetical protein